MWRSRVGAGVVLGGVGALVAVCGVELIVQATTGGHKGPNPASTLPPPLRDIPIMSLG